MDNGSEMQWVSNFCYMYGANYDALLIRTYNDQYAGCWQDYPISHGAHYICEKNDWFYEKEDKLLNNFDCLILK